MKKGTKTLLTTAAALGVITASASYFVAMADNYKQGENGEYSHGYEDNHKNKFKKSLRKMDSDGDGMLSREEFMAMMEGKGPFTKFDVNEDGVIEESDLEAYAAQKAQKMLEHLTTHLDENNDGKITQAEFDSHRDARFASFDSDDDGKLNRKEMREMIKARKAEYKNMRDLRG